MPAPRRSRRRPVTLAVAACGALLVVLSLAIAVPARAATGASTFADCGKITVDSKNLGAKFPKGGDATTTFNDVTIKIAAFREFRAEILRVHGDLAAIGERRS